jgi:hypothetical protein
MTIDAASRVGIGTTSPGDQLELSSGSIVTANNQGLKVKDTGGTARGIIKIDSSNNTQVGTATAPNRIFLAGTGSGEAVRIDSSGRLLVGTSTSVNTGTTVGASVEIFGSAGSLNIRRGSNNNSPAILALGKSRNTTDGSYTIVSNNDIIGTVRFAADDGTDLQTLAAEIKAEVDGTPGANDMPGRLVFSTTADGASSPTERMRITSTGDVLVNKTTFSDSVQYQGITLNDGGDIRATTNNATVGYFNRLGGDGELIAFYENTVKEGSISVSGSTVTYGGGHLARWSQLPNEEDPSDILKGTVMSNLDDMCEWGEEDNEQLNKTKVSDIEGDLNVAGVFVSTSFDDDGPLDFFVAMTGDMIIRIAEGVTVQRGDLLMSAGDGTAKPQDDDIIRSKTIAKVTSTHVTCTYDDGSYCVPCVLMAC